MVKVSSAVMMDITPAHASHEIFPRVRIEPVKKPITAATATKTAVHAPCRERAFRAVEILEKPAAATQIHPFDR
ncbi:hypothetical protein IG631_23152 [Alternaria alternata]|jgi:hypothetical protein|nr:hypothetical protein IG631_23152 [Alternaria alternata]